MKLTTHDTQEIEITLFLLFTNQFCTENRRLSSQLSWMIKGYVICCIVWCQHDGFHSLCSVSYSDDESLGAPTNLVTSEVKQSSFRTTWTPPDGTVDQFRVTYSIAPGGPPKEVRWALPFMLFCNQRPEAFSSHHQNTCNSYWWQNSHFIYLWQPKYKNIHPSEHKQCIKMLHKTHWV